MSDNKLEEYLRVYQEGDVIFREGEVGDTVLLIKSGSVDVLKGSGPDQRHLATISGGEVVGEMALEEGEHERTATVRASSEVEGWRFPGPAFESLIDKDRNFRQKLFRSLLSRLADTTDRLAEQETSDLRTLNRLLTESARVLLPMLDSEELEDDEVAKTVSRNHHDDFLAYHFDVSLDRVRAFRSLDGEGAPGELNDEERGEVRAFVRDVVDEVTGGIEVEDDGGGEADGELARAARTAKKLLDGLEDHSETYGNDKLQKIMEKRQDVQEVLEERKEAGRDDYLVRRTENLLTGIKQEINIRYD